MWRGRLRRGGGPLRSIHRGERGGGVMFGGKGEKGG